MMWADTRHVRLRTLFARRDLTRRPDLPMLSVYRDYGVVPREGRDDNYNKPGEDLAAYRVVRRGDLVLNKMKTWQGSLGISRYDGIVSPAYFVARPLTEDCPEFIHHLLRSSPLIAEYGARSKGIRPSQWDLPWEEFQSITVELPPIATQRRIADYLDRATARIDTLIVAKQRMVELLEGRFAGQVSTLLFESTPYQPVRLKFLCGLPTSGNRDHGSFTYTSAGVPCLRGVDLSNDSIDLSAILRISAEDSNRHANTKLHTGDLVIVRSGATAGRSALVTPDLDGSNCVDLVIVRRTPAVEPRYLAYVVRSRETQDRVLHASSGALQPHFNAVDAGEIMIPMRTLDEQKQIVRTIDTLASTKEQMAEALNRQVALLRERRQALIAAAVTGQLEIPEAA